MARPPFGPGLAADEPVDDELVPTRHQSLVEGAVRVLTNAAALLDAVLDSRDAAQAAALPPSQDRGHPFRGSTERGPEAEPPPPDVDAPATPRRPRTR